MLAFWLRALVFAELLLDLSIAWWMIAAGRGLPLALAAVVALALILRAVLVAITFTIARIRRSAIPPNRQLGRLASFVMFVRETAAFTLLFSVAQPFERLLMKDDELAPGHARPALLLVPGYTCNRGFWWWLRRRFRDSGWQVATLNLEPVFGSIDEYADAIHRRIEAVCARTGVAQVVLIGHSMGGLASHAYLRAHSARRVKQLITLGSPYHGSALARAGVGRNARQMRLGSAWLAELRTPDQHRDDVPITSIWSHHDNYVMPQDSSHLSGAHEIIVSGIGHLAMAYSPQIANILFAELEDAGVGP